VSVSLAGVIDEEMAACSWTGSPSHDEVRVPLITAGLRSAPPAGRSRTGVDRRPRHALGQAAASHALRAMSPPGSDGVDAAEDHVVDRLGVDVVSRHERT